MKTSNIIILSFAIVVVAFTLLLFIDAKNHEKIKSNENVIVYHKIAPFKVLVAENDSEIKITNASDFTVGVKAKNNKPDNKLYRIVNDTLFVFAKERIYVGCNNVNTYISNNCDELKIQSYKTDTLRLIANGGNVNVNSTDTVQYQFVHVEASQKGQIYLNDVTIETLKAIITNESTLQTRTTIGNATVSIKNKSVVGFYNFSPNFLTLKKDISSKIQIW